MLETCRHQDTGELRRPHINRLIQRATGEVPLALDELAARVLAELKLERTPPRITYLHDDPIAFPVPIASHDHLALRVDALETQPFLGPRRSTQSFVETLALPSNDPPPTRPAASLPAERAGRWRLLRPLGVGAMGAIFLGEDPTASSRDPERHAAIKLLLQEGGNSRKRFQREARALERVHSRAHPDADHVVRLLAAEPQAAQPWLAMELLDGQDLAEVLGAEGRLRIPQAVRVGLGIARGLRAAHAAGVFHRDLKPANVFCVQDGRVKLIDLGLARRVDGEESISVSLTGRAMGTPFYMSPEHVRGREIRAPADVYSCGAVLFHLLSGRPPFLLEEDEQLWALLGQHAHDPAPCIAEYVDGIPEALARLVDRCLEKEPAARPGVTELVETLAELVESCPGEPAARLPATPALRDIAGYRVHTELGRGAEGVVYRAHHADYGQVALKVLARSWDPTVVRRFEREARTTEALDCPHIVRTLDASLAPPFPYLALEFVNGPTLKQRVEERGPVLNGDEALRLMRAVATALAAAHESGSGGIVHRDLKPSNILGAGPGGTPKLADFGLARDVGDESDPARGLVGTAEYMAPEQVRGEAPTPATDVYGFGAAFYYALTGARPFAASERTGYLYKHLHELPRPARERNQAIHEHVDLLLRKCLFKDPAERYPDGGALLAELETVGYADFPDEAIHAAWEREVATYGAARRPARWIVLVALLALVLVGSLALAHLAASAGTGGAPAPLGEPDGAETH